MLLTGSHQTDIYGVQQKKVSQDFFLQFSHAIAWNFVVKSYRLI